MNTLHDPHSHKRTSINELLNPVAATPAVDGAHHPIPLPHHLGGYADPAHYQHHQMSSQAPMHLQPSQGAFKLSAASWDQGGEGEQALAAKKPDQQPAYNRSYPVQPPPPAASPGVYQEQQQQQHPQRAQRPREEQNGNNNFTFDPQLWQSPGVNEANLSYTPSLITPSYSDERTTISGDVVPSNPATYPMPRPDQPPNNFRPDPAMVAAYQQQQQRAQPPQNMGAWPPPADHRIPPRAGEAHMPPQMYAQPQYYQPHPGMPYNMYHQPPMQGPGLPQMHMAIPYMQQPQPPPPQKRPTPQADGEESGTKTKKARTSKKSATDGNGNGSRRGYNAKKRSEAAQIAAQNAQLMPNVSYTPMGGDKGKQKAADGAMRIVSDSGAQNAETRGPLHPELQFARCMSNRYKSENFPRCVSCTRRWAGDTCRFQGIRFFLKDDNQNIVGVSFVENQKADAPTMNFPTRWNISLEPSHIEETKRTVAVALLPTLKKEFEHLIAPQVIRRPRESDVRATCDTCMTSIFSSSWMCRLCGREACAECFGKVRELTEYRAGANEAEIAALQAKREAHAHSNPFFLSCTRRNEHVAKEFSPVSRFCEPELQDVIDEMELLIKAPPLEPEEDEGESTATDTAIDPSLKAQDGAAAAAAAAAAVTTRGSPTDETASSAVPAPTGGDAAPAAAPVAVSADPGGRPEVNGTEPSPTEPHVYPTQTFADGELSEKAFRKIWRQGVPVVITGLLPKFTIKWTPEYFISKYSAQTCSIVECQTDASKRITVGEFFKMFGSYEGRTDCWKLKDWPPSTDFKAAFPELYEDFTQAVPMPTFCRRDGALNIASHFPVNTVAPDLGPKMYNAMATYETQGSKGSTRLHMDMADAINIMMHAEPRPDGTPGVAAWDLFRAEDAENLRRFLRKRYNGTQMQHDPIHAQQIYLDSRMLRELYKEYGIRSHRVYQKPGDAVFIPAGCAHQVCNLADCIKVAADFVSLENVARCEKLTGEFREQNQSMMWKEDVLQLRAMMWFAWLSCKRQEGYGQ